MEAMVKWPTPSFWQGKRVLLTGHTGFKGSWLSLWLHRLGAQVTGIALPPASRPNLFELARIESLVDSHFCDIRNAKSLSDHVRTVDPEVVLHLAAQPLVRASYEQPVETFAVNLMGTVHLMEIMRQFRSLRVALMITTDKVYRPAVPPVSHREGDALGGHDPYSASKAAMEIALACYRDSFLQAQGIAVSSARAGNVVGGGDWSKDRLIPDAIRAWKSEIPLKLRHPEAVRPWQHVLEALAGYLALVEHTWDHPLDAGAYNFGPSMDQIVSVETVIALARDIYGQGSVIFSREDKSNLRETEYLTLDSSKTASVFGLSAHWNLKETIEKTVRWYRRLSEGVDARLLCNNDIDAFCSNGPSVTRQ